MNPPETNDPLDALLREQDKYIEDNGFTARVVAALPRRRRAWLRPVILMGAVAIGSVLAVGWLPWERFAGARFFSVAFARLPGADAVGAGALGHGFPCLGYDFRAGMGRLKPRRTIHTKTFNAKVPRRRDAEKLTRIPQIDTDVAGETPGEPKRNFNRELHACRAIVCEGGDRAKTSRSEQRLDFADAEFLVFDGAVFMAQINAQHR